MNELLTSMLTYTRVTDSLYQGSSGMGLAISKAVLKLHGADFGARNVSESVEFYIHM